MKASCEELQTPLSASQLRNLPVEVLGQASLLFFMNKVLGLQLNWHFREWADRVQIEKRLVIECARGHGKSYFFSLVYPLWLAHKSKKPFSICIASFSQAQSTRLVTEIKREIERNIYLRHLLPELADTWGKTSLFLSNNVSVTSESFGSSVRGGHFDFLIVDDPTKDFGSMTREDQVEFFNSVFLPTINPEGQIVVIGTPVDKRDILHYLEQNPVYKTFKYPAIIDNKPLWPERYSLGLLNQLKAEMGSARFNREYLLQIVDSESAIFRESWIKTTPFMPSNLDIYIGVDLAVGQRSTSDYFALVVVGVDGDKNAYVIDYVKEHYTLQQQIDSITWKSKQYKPIKVAIEAVAYQAALPNHLIATTGIPIQKVMTRSDKIVRAEKLSTYFENQKIKIREGLNGLIDELIYFPRFEHDDLVDALGFAVDEAMEELEEVQAFII